MIVLNLSRRIQRFIGVYRGDLSNPKEYLIKLALNVMAIGSYGVLFFGSIGFIWVNSLDFGSSMNTILILMGVGSGIGCYFGITTKTKSISKLYDVLQDLANESNEIKFY